MFYAQTSFAQSARAVTDLCKAFSELGEAMILLHGSGISHDAAWTFAYDALVKKNTPNDAIVVAKSIVSRAYEYNLPNDRDGQVRISKSFGKQIYETCFTELYR